MYVVSGCRRAASLMHARLTKEPVQDVTDFSSIRVVFEVAPSSLRATRQRRHNPYADSGSFGIQLLLVALILTRLHLSLLCERQRAGPETQHTSTYVLDNSGWNRGADDFQRAQGKDRRPAQMRENCSPMDTGTSFIYVNRLPVCHLNWAITDGYKREERPEVISPSVCHQPPPENFSQKTSVRTIHLTCPCLNHQDGRTPRRSSTPIPPVCATSDCVRRELDTPMNTLRVSTTMTKKCTSKCLSDRHRAHCV